MDQVKDRLKHVPGTWAFWRCRDCGSAMLSPFPQAQELASFYPAVYDFSLEQRQQNSFKRLLSQLEYRLFFQPQHEAQARQILRGTGGPNRLGRRLLDVGTGQGFPLLALKQHGYQVHGTDFRPAAVEYLQKQLGIPATCTDVSNLNQHFPPASFDVVTAFHTLEHVPDVRSVVNSCYLLIKPGGWFVSTVPFVDSVQARLFKSRWSGASEAPRHLSLPSHEGIARVCRQAGFDSVTIRPGTLLDCAGVLVLSLLPNTGSRHFRQSLPLHTLIASAAGGLAGLAAIPWCLIENYLLRRPSMGIVFSHKPETA